MLKINKDWIFKVRALYGKMSHRKIADEIGAEVRHVRKIIRDEELKKTKTMLLDESKNYAYRTGKVVVGAKIKLEAKKYSSSYKCFSNQIIEIVEEYPAFFIAKSEKNIRLTISKTDLHTNNLKYELVS